jgi:hypothetical protein
VNGAADRGTTTKVIKAPAFATAIYVVVKPHAIWWVPTVFVTTMMDGGFLCAKFMKLTAESY